jgi:radical SAM superfamily enzyme YgiQ (UPF0313 family)
MVSDKGESGRRPHVGRRGAGADRKKPSRGNRPDAADLILVSCPWEVADGRKQEHLGLGYLSSFLASHGHSVRVIDANFSSLDLGQVVEQIEGEPARVVGFSVIRANLSTALEVADRLRAGGMRAHITMGGHEPTFKYSDILAHNEEVDSVVLGEGEQTLLDLVGRICARTDWHAVPGIAHRGPDGKVVCNRPRDLIRDLSLLPFPDRSLYGGVLTQSGTASVYSSRGCLGNCSLCGINAFYGVSRGPKWRGRTPENVVDEIETLVREFRIKTISFEDDEFVGGGPRGVERAYGIGRQLVSRNIEVNYTFQCRPDNVDGPLLEFLMGTGLSHVGIGVESWIPRQLEMYGKNISVDQIETAIATLDEIGLNYYLYVVFFDPYVSIEELRLNLDAVARVGVEHVLLDHLFNPARIAEHLPIYDRVLRDGLADPEAPGQFAPEGMYTFRERPVEEAFRFGHEMLSLLRRMFLPLQSDAGLEGNLAAQLFLRSAELAIRRLVVARYGQVLLALQKGDEQGVRNLGELTSKELEKFCRDLGAICRSGELSDFQSRIELNVGRQTVRYPPKELEEFVSSLAHRGSVSGSRP